MNVRIEQVEKRRFVGMMHRGPYPEIGATWKQFGEWGGAQGLFTPDAVKASVFLDDPETTPAAELRSYAAIATDRTDFADGAETFEAGGGKYAIATYVGSFAGLPGAWGEFSGEWMKQNAKPRPGDWFEIYVSDMMTTPEADLITELYIPIE